MKFVITAEHRHFFEQKNAIEFEGLLDSDQLKLFLNALNTTLSERLHINPRNLQKQTPQAQFMAGHDLWRANDALKKIIAHTRLAEIAAQLTGQRVLRLGYDQFLPSLGNSVYQIEGSYSEIINSQSSLEEISSLQGITCGLMLCLETDSEEAELATPVDSDSKIQVFSNKSGNGIFFSPVKPIDFTPLKTPKGKSFLLIAYTISTAVYIYRRTDPLGPAWQSVGYSLGDRLVDKWNPIVYRR